DSHAFGPTLEREESNYFIGGGPHVGLTLTRTLGDSGVYLLAKADSGVMMGGATQQFSELARDLAGNPLGFGYTSRGRVQTSPTLAAMLGAGGDLPFLPRGRWQLGYQFEQWWSIGNFPGTFADLRSHGVIIKMTYDY